MGISQWSPDFFNDSNDFNSKDVLILAALMRGRGADFDVDTTTGGLRLRRRPGFLERYSTFLREWWWW